MRIWTLLTIVFTTSCAIDADGDYKGFIVNFSFAFILLLSFCRSQSFTPSFYVNSIPLF